MGGTVESILRDKKVDFRESGADYVVKCLNPGHDDSNPSMRINRLSGVFNCFSCGFSGNLFNYFGIQRSSYVDQKAQSLIDAIHELKKKPLAFPLPNNIAYNNSFRGIDTKTLKAFGAFTNSFLPELEDRLCFPISDTLGNVYAIMGRDMVTSAKARKYNVYPKGIPLSPYPAIIKPINSTIFIVEGIFDLLNMHQHGATNTIALLGVAAGLVKKPEKKDKWRKVFNRYKLQGVTSIKIMLDNDKTGKAAAEGLESLLSNMFSTSILNIEGVKDPGELSKKQVQQLLQEI